MHLSMWSTKVGRMERKQVEVTVVNMKQVWSTLVKASTPGRGRFLSLPGKLNLTMRSTWGDATTGQSLKNIGIRKAMAPLVRGTCAVTIFCK